MRNEKTTIMKANNGFSLIEMAIVLFIVALLMGGLLPTISSQIEQKNRSDTRKKLDEIQQALLGYAIINGRLPCPASNTSNGLESPSTGGNCSNFFNGFVPAATLGLSPINNQGLLLDEWNNPIRYAVSNKTIGISTFALTTTNGMKNATISSLAGTSLLYVCSSATNITTTACGPSPVITLTSDASAVIFSLGKNGGTTAAGIDETANSIASNDKMFVSHDPAPVGATNGEFDDILVWIPSVTLINRMVTAGQLP